MPESNRRENNGILFLQRIVKCNKGKCAAVLISMAAVMIAAAGRAHAYIGPGAGFVIVGGVFVMFTALVTAIFTLFTWPIRFFVRTIRGRRAFARSRIRKCVILGFDGMDPGMVEKLMGKGELPNLARLRERGCFKPLATTVPSISPVAWSSFQTGVNPGKHSIFDFLTRDKRSYRPKLSSVDIGTPRRRLNLGKYSFPLGKGDIRLLRKSRPFWKTLGEHGIFSSVLRVPITYPPERFYGVQLSGMCVPDLRGTQGMFSYYTTMSDDGRLGREGCYPVTRKGDTIEAALVGPENPFRRDGSVLECPFVVTIRDRNTADIRIDSKKYELDKGVYTEWIRVGFRAAPGICIHGICKLLLLGVEPEFELYVTPVNIDPEKPAMPITYPPAYSIYLSKLQGPFATLGLAEDSWALNEKVITDDYFIQQCIDIDREREKMFFDALDKVRRGLCACVFDGTDRIQHTFWRDIDEEHPVRNGAERNGRNAIAEVYKRMDDLVGRTFAACRDGKTLLMIISDHGFNTFRYGVDLNRWLEKNGYLSVKDGRRDSKYLDNVDWSKTRAFALGLAGIYLNLKGREALGIVEPGDEAERLREEISEKLAGLFDTERNQRVIKQIYNSRKIYSGPYKDEAPDLLIGYNRGYRASWETAIGQITELIIHDNKKPWSGDHCIDPSLVPGVLFCNRAVATEHPRLIDIGPTVLDMFGIEVPGYMDGRPLDVADAGREPGI